MILLMIHLFSSAVFADSNSPSKPILHCVEDQPNIAANFPNRVARGESRNLPMSLSVDVKSSCADAKADLANLCVESVKCFVFGESEPQLTQTIHETLDSSTDDKDKNIKATPNIQFNALTERQKALIFDHLQNSGENYLMFPWTMVCNKKSYTHNDANHTPYIAPNGQTQFCPVPDKCEDPKDATNIKIAYGEYLPREAGAMGLRMATGTQTGFTTTARDPIPTAPAGAATNNPPK